MGSAHILGARRLEHWRDADAANSLGKGKVVVGGFPHDKPERSVGVHVAHGLERLLVEAGECVCALLHHRLRHVVQLAAVLAQDGVGVELAWIRLHLKFDEDVVPAGERGKDLLQGRRRLRARPEACGAELVEGKLLDYARPVGGALHARVVHYDEPVVSGESDVHLKAADAFPEAPGEAAGGVVLILAATAAVGLDERTEVATAVVLSPELA